MVAFGNRLVGDGAPVFITLEAGPTHNGLESAKQLVAHAAAAGADAIKFQIVDPDRLVADRKLPFTYEVLVDRASGKTETVTEPLYDILCRRSLAPDEWRELKQYCDQKNLAFFATVAFEDELEMVAKLGCDSIKIASADVDHFPFIRKAARTGLCLQLDTGNATIGEIEAAIDVIRAEGNENIIIHHCPSGYPARLESINLNVIPTLKRMFSYPVAFSDHTPGWDMDVAAVAMGANMVEKTITLDRTTRSVEHIMSLEPADMHRFVRVIREIEVAKGSCRRIMSPTEAEKRRTYRRSIHLNKDLPAGHILTEADFAYARPGVGISPRDIDRVVGKTLRHARPAQHRLEWSDLN
jgi:N,N'-diacetyllegionaminate synthase